MKNAPLIIISGPSGVGKTTTTNHLLKRFWNLHRIVTATTRPPREGERHGHDYLFLSQNAFDELDAAHCFIETNHFAQASYATPKSVLALLKHRIACVVIPDINGAKKILELVPDAVTIWLDAPLDVMRTRLAERSTESEEEQEKRIAIAAAEQKEAHASGIYTHIVDMSSYEEGEATLIHLLAKIF